MKTIRCEVSSVDRRSRLPIAARFVDPCPFCGDKHSHGFGDGPRRPHCKPPVSTLDLPNYELVMPRGDALREQLPNCKTTTLSPWGNADWLQTEVAEMLTEKA